MVLKVKERHIYYGAIKESTEISDAKLFNC